MHAPPSSHLARSRGGRFAAAVVAAAAVLAGAAVGTIAPAGPAIAVSAGVQQPGLPITGVTGYGESWLGAMQPPNGYAGDVTFCISVGGRDPVGTTPAGEGTIDDPLLAAALARHQWDDDAWARAALGYLAHARWEQGANGVSASERKRRYEVYTPQVIKDTAAAFLAEAAAFAGPYAGATLVPGGAGSRTGTVRGVGVTNGSGGWTAGLPFIATLSGPAVFDATGGATHSGVTGAQPSTLAWTATGTGQVTVAVTYRDLPRTTLTLIDGPGDVQDLVTYGHRPASDRAETSSPPVPFEVVDRFQPVASSAVAAHVVATGTTLVDTLTVRTAPGDTWLSVAGRPVPVTFVGTAYSTGDRPPAAPGAVPAGATAVGTARLTVTGPGTYSASVPGGGAGGFVTWVWRMRVAEQPEAWRTYLRGDWQDAFGLPAETTSVRHRSSATSQVVVRSDGDGRASGLADDVALAGFPADHPDFAGGAGFTADRATVTQSLWYFPEDVEVTDANRAAARLLGQVEVRAADGEVPAVGDGAFPLPRTATGAGLPGTYVFTHAFAGDDRVEPFETSVTAASERFVLAPRPLAVTTTAVADRAPVLGDQVLAHDVATVTGDIPVGATVDFELYEWEAGGPPRCAEPVWTSPRLTLTGEGEVTSPTGDVAELAGDLGFVAVVRDADGAELVRGACGAADEVVRAETYEVVTWAEADRPAVRGDRVTVRDVARADGTIPTDATLTFELYTWPAGEPVCEEPVWRSEPVPFVAGETASPPVVVDPVAGDLGFVEVVRGTDGRELSRGACGAPGETVRHEVLDVTTTARSGGAVVLGRGAEVWDEASVSGLPAPGTTVTFELYTWPRGAAPQCAAPVWTSEPVDLAGGGAVASGRATVASVAGPLGFVAVTRGADGRVLARGECGADGETLAATSALAATGAAPAWPAAAALAALAGGVAAVVAGRRWRAGR